MQRSVFTKRIRPDCQGLSFSARLLFTKESYKCLAFLLKASKIPLPKLTGGDKSILLPAGMFSCAWTLLLLLALYSILLHTFVPVLPHSHNNFPMD